MMQFYGKRRRYGWCRSPEKGIWWLRLGRWLFVIKAGWNAPLFSERYSYYALRIPLGRGWRFIVKHDYPSRLNLHKPHLGN